MVAPKPARRRTLAVAAASLAAAAVLAGCGSSSGSSNGAQTGYVKVTTGISQVKAADRQAMPALSGTTLQGKSLSVDYTGHVTVINVWGSWCTPCREEAPDFAEAYQKYHAKGVEFVGINTRDDNAAAIAYNSQFGISYPSLQDPDETLVLDLKEIIPATSVPSTVIVDSSGKVAVRALGGITEPELLKEIDYTLSGS
ncbi:TlpA family protein disulfide reductase [Actinospica sp. MGRD01-02]|uniref:TlpA family protein disulfide reductase n=1 Tax=Actinospica acidithermotolerans TaxID=2828514 RepID=A0A941EA62_9ACTN|nr:TlpA disulfide reductase family protein [Actinospica acidithermotolerans]MBR7827417.1 TlpA family protein disulfide reductase [Actinospica acidithermotolerans]